jgi:predicted permease
MTDFRFAFRQLAKSPGFTVIAVLTLALGIGATTTVYSWIDRVLLNPLPGTAAPGRLVALETLAASGEMIDSSYPDFRDYRAGTHTLSGLLAFKERPLTLGQGEHASRLWTEFVSANFFDLLGVTPLHGRFFAPADRADEPAAAPVAVISENLWRTRFASDPSIIGRTIAINQHDFTVIGIAPATFPGSINGLGFDAWLPLPQWGRWIEQRSNRALHLLGRLAPGATVAQADAELKTLARDLAAAHPDTNREIGITVVPVTKSPHGAHHELAQPLLFLLGVSVLVLVIVCANLANLLFVRACSRQREMCIRQALGAGGWRLLRQLLAESFVLAALGGGLGLLLTLWLADLFRLFLHDATLPLALASHLDGGAVALAGLLSVGTSIAASLAPALWVMRPDLVNVLRASGRAAEGSRQPERLRHFLVAAEVAIALLALACAGLAAKSFYAARHANPGFDSHGVLLVGVMLEDHGYTHESGVAFFSRLHERLAALPGVQSVALSEDVPLGLRGGSWDEVAIPGYAPSPGENMKIYRNRVSNDYFSLMRIPLIHGRAFNDRDLTTTAIPAVVNATFARRYFGTTDATGHTFSIWGGARVLTIVGVADDVAIRHIGETVHPYFYVLFPRFYDNGTGAAVHLRTAGDPLALLPDVRRAINALDPNLPVFDALTLDDYVSASRFAQRTAASLLSALSALAVALAALGLYGVLSFAVAQRIPEIGVRLALGASPGDIVRLVLHRGLILVGAGTLAGLLAALAVGHLLYGLLYGVSPYEPLLLLATAALIFLTGLLASWLPARRAAQVDPMVALRAE